jgi:hypothetical protein
MYSGPAVVKESPVHSDQTQVDGNRFTVTRKLAPCGPFGSGGCVLSEKAHRHHSSSNQKEAHQPSPRRDLSRPFTQFRIDWIRRVTLSFKLGGKYPSGPKSVFSTRNSHP